MQNGKKNYPIFRDQKWIHDVFNYERSTSFGRALIFYDYRGLLNSDAGVIFDRIFRL